MHLCLRWSAPAAGAALRRLGLATACLAMMVIAGGQPASTVDAVRHSPIDGSEPPTGELWVQNMTEVDPATAITARFFDADRSRDFPTILLPTAPRADDLLRIGTVAAQLPDGQYATSLAPGKPFPSAAVARNEWPATGAAVIYSTSEADTRVVVPWVIRRFGERSASSRVRIQNARPDRPAVVTVKFTAMGTNSAALSLTRTIPAGYATELDLARDADLAALPDGFAGALSAQVAAGFAIAAVATTELEGENQAAYATIGQRSGALGDRLVAPLVTSRRAQSRRDGTQVTLDSFIAVMNAGNASIPVTVTYRGIDAPDNACAGQTLVHGGGPHQIPAGSVVVFAQGTEMAGSGVGTSGLPENCEATAVIRSGGGSLAATVVEVEDGGKRAGAYEAQASSALKSTAYIPLFRRGFDNLSTAIQVANAGDQPTTVRVKMVLVGDGRTTTVERSAALAPGAAASWDASSLSEIPDGAAGGVVITGSAADVPLVAVARETADDGKVDNALYGSAVEPTKIDNPAPIPDIYQPFFAPSIWKSGVYDLGLMATGTTPAEILRVKAALNAQAFAFAKQTGLTIAVSVQPYMFGKVPFPDWLEDQIGSGFPDFDVRARTWLVGLNYNAVTLLGQAGYLQPVSEDAFPGQGDFLDEAWGLNFVTMGPRPLAVPWLRQGCSPNYRNLALLAESKDPDAGFRLMSYLARPEQQRENYQPQSPGRGQIGYPTLKALYTQFGITCPAAPEILRPAPPSVAGIVHLAVADADRLASAFGSLDVDVYGDAANAAKATGVESGGQLVIAQPMVNFMSPEDLNKRLSSAAGLVVGTISLRRLPTPTPTDTSTPTATPTDTATPTPTATELPSSTPTKTSTPTASSTATITPMAPTPTTRSTTPATPTASRTVTPGATATAMTTPVPSLTPSPEPARPIFLPYAAGNHPLSPSALAIRLARSAATGVRAPFFARPNEPRSARQTGQLSAHQAISDTTAFAVVWHKQPDGSIRTDLVPAGGGPPVEPTKVGISATPVASQFKGGQEPEAWIQRGSIVVCLNVDQYKGCMTVSE